MDYRTHNSPFYIHGATVSIAKSFGGIVPRLRVAPVVQKVSGKNAMPVDDRQILADPDCWYTSITTGISNTKHAIFQVSWTLRDILDQTRVPKHWLGF